MIGGIFDQELSGVLSGPGYEIVHLGTITQQK
jgi:hypothetical protein